MFRTILHPAWYHGHRQSPPFFEGWYYKIVTADGSGRYAIIPGIIKGDQGHAFIQVLNGVTGTSTYHSFPFSAFWAAKNGFEVTIGANRFQEQSIQLHLNSPEISIHGNLHFPVIHPWPVSILSPGIMGPYSWVPAMECYHGVVSLDHAIAGELEIDGNPTNFSGGRGYTEKDWGKSFPSAWIWFQSNHFERPGMSITASVAVIPWLRSTFRGFIIGLWLDQQLYRFANYTGAQIERLESDDQSILWIVHDRKYRLEMQVQRSSGGSILGPTPVEMGKRVNETLSAIVRIRLSTVRDELLFEGQGRFSGLEAHGDINQLV